MEIKCTNEVQSELNVVLSELYTLESIIELIKDTCLEKELSLKYYGLKNCELLKLSTERSHYINLLSICLDKINNLKKVNENLELNFSNYNNTPTIAADK